MMVYTISPSPGIWTLRSHCVRVCHVGVIFFTFPWCGMGDRCAGRGCCGRVCCMGVRFGCYYRRERRASCCGRVWLGCHCGRCCYRRERFSTFSRCGCLGKYVFGKRPHISHERDTVTRLILIIIFTRPCRIWMIRSSSNVCSPNVSRRYV